MFASKKEHLCIICDVGSASLSVGIILYAQNKKPQIITTKTFPISIGPKPNTQELDVRIKDFFDKAMFWASHEGLSIANKVSAKKKTVEDVFVTLASPWYVSRTSKVIIEKEKPFELNEDIIQSAVKTEESVFEKDILDGKYEQLKSKDTKIIEREIVAVRLNGYETTNPKGKVATNAEFSFFMSVAPMDILSSMNTIVKKYFHIDEILFRTFPSSFLGATKRIYPHERDFILIDIAGESTDVSAVLKGVIEHSTSFFSGANNAVRLIMDKFKVTEEIAISFISMNQTGTIEPNVKKEVDDLILRDGLAWNKSFIQIMEEIKKKAMTSTTCFIVCDQPFSTLFENRVKELGSSFALSHIIFVNPSKLMEHVDIGKMAKKNEFIMIESIFFENNHANSRLWV